MDRLKRWWQNLSIGDEYFSFKVEEPKEPSSWFQAASPVVETIEIIEQPEEPTIEFASFQCDTCGDMVTLDEYIMPGQVGVIRCECGESWTVYAPPLSRFKTADLPEDLHSVWEQLSYERADE